jgi:drug/metabolite transporter (DMT)-like permease
MVGLAVLGLVYLSIEFIGEGSPSTGTYAFFILAVFASLGLMIKQNYKATKSWKLTASLTILETVFVGFVVFVVAFIIYGKMFGRGPQKTVTMYGDIHHR